MCTIYLCVCADTSASAQALLCTIYLCVCSDTSASAQALLCTIYLCVCSDTSASAQALLAIAAPDSNSIFVVGHAPTRVYGSIKALLRHY
jgi:hypothetical protein